MTRIVGLLIKSDIKKGLFLLERLNAHRNQDTFTEEEVKQIIRTYIDDPFAIETDYNKGKEALLV